MNTGKNYFVARNLLFVPFLLSPYFLNLMEKLRKNIIQVIVVLLVCSGFGISLVQPVHAQYAPDAFADWLSTMAKSTNAGDLQDDLDDLRKSQEHMDQIIKQASHLVKKNNENFGFSDTESMASAQLYQLLLIEWNHYQTGNGMSGIPVRHMTKSVMPDKVQESMAFAGLISIPEEHQQISIASGNIDFTSTSYFSGLMPMAGGIAIGAP